MSRKTLKHQEHLFLENIISVGCVLKEFFCKFLFTEIKFKTFLETTRKNKPDFFTWIESRYSNKFFIPKFEGVVKTWVMVSSEKMCFYDWSDSLCLQAAKENSKK